MQGKRSTQTEACACKDDVAAVAEIEEKKESNVTLARNETPSVFLSLNVECVSTRGSILHRETKMWPPSE